MRASPCYQGLGGKSLPFSLPDGELAPVTWTPGLSCQSLRVSAFKFHRAEIAERRMAPTAVIEQFEVFENGGARLGAGPPLNLVDEVDLQACKEAFGDRVVPAIAAAAHAAANPVLR